MNLRNKKLVMGVRILFGLFILYSGIGGFLASAAEMKGVPEAMINATLELQANGLFYMIKITEIITGLMLLLNFRPALALLGIAPIGVGVVVFNANIAPAFVISGIVVCLFTAFLGYAYWDKYKPLFVK